MPSTIAAALTPLRDDGASLDLDALDPYLAFLKTGGIDGVLADGEHVAATRGLEKARAEHATKTRHEVLQRGSCGGGNPIRPQVVNQLVDGPNLTCVHEQRREERAAQLAAEGHCPPTLHDLDGAENAELDRYRARPAPATRWVRAGFDMALPPVVSMCFQRTGCGGVEGNHHIARRRV